MRSTRYLGAGALIALALVSLGCKKKAVVPEAMGEAAPAYDGKQPLGQFLAGVWCLGTGVSSETAKAYGADDSSTVETTQSWQFASDGTFVVSNKTWEGQVRGTWAPQGNGIMLDYKSWNDQPLDAARQKFKDDSAAGTQAAIAKELKMDNDLTFLLKLYYLELGTDKKTLEFTDPGHAEAQSGDILSLSTAGGTLVRMK